MAGALAALLLATPAAADPDPGKGPPDPPPAPVASCAVVPSGNSEFATCLGVTAKLDRVPSVGETATLTATLRSTLPLGARLTVTLPEQLAWAQKPAASAVTLTADRPVTVTGVVKSVKEGFGQIVVRATAPDAGGPQTGQDVVFLTVGAAGQVSRFGALTTSGSQPAVPVTPAKVFQRPGGEKLRSATASGNTASALTCDTIVKGNWGYFGTDNLFHNEMNVNVVINDTVNGRVGGQLTDFNGNFNICVDSSRATHIVADIYLANDEWQVQHQNGNQFHWTTEVHAVTPGVTVNIGSRTSDAANSRALHAFDEADDAWQFIPKTSGSSCWDQKETACRQLKINWEPASTDGTFYQLNVTNDIHLVAADPDAPIVVAHEIGHFIMDDVYNDAFPAAPGCSPHVIDSSTNAGCAWVEGFADWFALAVNHDSSFRWPGGISFSLETPSWSDRGARGDTVESRVAGAMLDVQDSTNELFWDRAAEGFANLWFTFNHHINGTFNSFWASRIGDGFNNSDTGALASVYHNTIDYGFRDPLPDNTAVSRTVATPHNYSMNTSTNFWSAIAIGPSVGSDVDMTVYDDRGQTLPLASSTGGVNVIDFVAVDSNRRALGDYYPRVNEFSGGTGYAIEVYQARNILGAGSTTVHMPNDLVYVTDTFLTAGVPVALSVTPSTTEQNPSILLMGDDPANAATFVQGRFQAKATGAAFGPGIAESLTYTPTLSGWYGVVITSQHGVGDYTLTRS
ncbi:hypothetical protein [Actinoplanes sp. NPDC026619]|uniref:hypothetical protein n=1 Tax=Actinoplanes sp. NPDC026619 TaxID=3155798 RepID=UPI0033E7D60E